MEKKNLFLAVLLLASTNCPTITNTADAGAAVVAESSSSLFNPQGFNWKTIGALGAAIGTSQIIHRVIKNGVHSENEIGTVYITNPKDIKKINITVKMESKETPVTLKNWNQTHDGTGKSIFAQKMKSDLNLHQMPKAKLTYEVSLTLENGTALLTKPLKKSDTIILDKRNNHEDFIEVLWENVISHAFILANDCINTNSGESKSASELPHAAKFDIAYQAEITQIDYTLSPHTLVKAIPLAVVANYTGFPTSRYGLLAYTGAYVTTRLMSKKLGNATRGLNLELPKKKTTLTAGAKDELTNAIDAFKLKHSTKNNVADLKTWTTEKNRLVDKWGKATTLNAKKDALKELAAHAQLEKTFAITQVAILTDKVSGLTLKYATPKEIIKTGALKRKKVLKVSDLNINLTGGDYWNDAKAVCDAGLTGIWNGICFLNPFGEDDDLEVNNEDELEL